MKSTPGRTRSTSIVDRAALAILLAAAWFAPVEARAHPVAQGAMKVLIEPGKIAVEARVSTEEVFVASTFAPPTGSHPASLDAVWTAHGPYLLDHLRVFADDRLLTGRVAAVHPPGESSLPGSTEHVVYRLEYPLADAAAVPARVRMEEDVLKEFSYAPGNPWTASYVVHVEAPGQQTVDGLLLDRNQPLDYHPAEPGKDTAASAPAQPARIDHWQVVKEYFVHGIFHILTGYDHMLFMGALVLAAMSLWDLVKVVSAFTLAHTITLTLSVLNIVRLSEHIVEPMISASIVFVAVQNIVSPRRSRGWSRLAAAFFFGLFHGLGFAGGLLDAMAGLPPVAIGTAIGAFSLGVEFGHQCVVLPVFGGLKIGEHYSRNEFARRRMRLLVERYGSAAISMAGMFYLVVALRG